MRRAVAPFLLAVTLAATSPLAHAQLPESRFTNDAEGWQNVMLPYPSAIPPTILNTYAPIWTAGYIRLTDPDGSGSSGDAQYWRAPAAFHGNLLAAYGDSLAFDIANAGSGFGSFHQEDVILIGGGITLAHDLGSVPSGAWTHYAVSLTAPAWHVDSLAGPAPTPAQFATVLGSVTELLIRAEYQLGPDEQSLDNVVLTSAATGIGPDPDARTLELAAPRPNPAVAATTLGFALPRAGSVDLGVYDVGGRRVATLVRGTLPAGEHSATWDGREASGHSAGAGVFWVRLALDAEVCTRMLVRLR